MQLPQDLYDFDAFAQRIEHEQLHFACLRIVRGKVRTIKDVRNFLKKTTHDLAVHRLCLYYYSDHQSRSKDRYSN